MKINHLNRMGIIKSYQKTVQAPNDREWASARKDQPLKSPSKDHLEISPEAIEQLKRSKEETSSRSLKIEQLKEQVASGAYQVDSEKLAEKLLGFWKKF